LKLVNRIPQHINSSRVDPFLAAGFDCFENGLLFGAVLNQNEKTNERMFLGRAPARILRYTISKSASVPITPVVTRAAVAADRA